MGGATYKMIFLGNVYSQNSWAFPNIPAFLLGQYTSLSMSAPNPLVAAKVVRQWIRAGHLEDDSSA